MELNQISNNIDFTIQNDYMNLNKITPSEIDKVSDTSGIKSDIVSLDQNFGNTSNIAFQFRDDMKQLADIQKTETLVQTQKETVTKLEFVVNNEPDINNAQKEVNDLMDSYNNGVKVVYSNLNELIEDRENDDSHIFFDGILGSIPMSVEEINKAVQQQKENLGQIEEVLNNQTTQLVDKFEKAIVEEKEVSVEVTKQVDFGKESVDFSNNNLQGIASAVVSTQPNPALQAHSQKLLS